MGRLAADAIAIEALDADGLTPAQIAEHVSWTPTEIENFLMHLYASADRQVESEYEPRVEDNEIFIEEWEDIPF